MALTRVKDQVELGLVAFAVHRMYDTILKPRIVNEHCFDLRAARILGAQEYFKSEKFAQAVPDLIRDIIMELQRLMPTPEQIAGSRNCSTDRYATLKPIRVFEQASV